MFENIPEEMRSFPQWVVWRYEDRGPKPTKVPYSPTDPARHADVTAPETWATFAQAVETADKHKFDGIGFVFTKNDPFAGIDLDDAKGDTATLDRQLKVYKEFDSYSESSPSNLGLHIIVKGSVPSGRRRSSIEVYSDGRFFTMTGKVYHASPVQERHDLLNVLWAQMAGGSDAAKAFYDPLAPQKQSDEEVVAQCLKAVNGDKAQLLLQGKWEDAGYPSQSEADFSLIDILAFYTQNREQIRRIFSQTPLGARDKAKRNNYVNRMIDRSFDRMLPPVDFDGLANAMSDRLAAQSKTNDGASSNGRTPAFEAVNVGSIPAAPTNNSPIAPSMPTESPPQGIQRPPGLLGDIADYVYATAPRPVYEYAVAAAIGLMAGICGRAYNVSGTGLNQYILALGETGTGKEAIASGIGRLMAAVKTQVPSAIEFIGPSEIASGQALRKFITKTRTPSFVSIIGEMGLRMQQMGINNASSHEMALYRILLDLYTKSGKNQSLDKSIFADAANNSEIVEAPAFSVLGESTPTRFYPHLTEDMVSDGLLPRFLVIEYHGERMPLNEKHTETKPTFQLINTLCELCAYALNRMHNNSVIDVMSDYNAQRIFADYERWTTAQINTVSKDAIRQLYNRAHLKVLKLAALAAVGAKPYQPEITSEHVLWAIRLVNADVEAMMAKFRDGKIGTSSTADKQDEELRNAINAWVSGKWNDLKAYKVGTMELHRAHIIPYSYLSRRLISQAAFKNDRRGSTAAIKAAIQNLIDASFIVECGKKEMKERYGFDGRSFMVADIWNLGR